MKRFLCFLSLTVLWSCGQKTDSQLLGEIGDMQGDIPSAGRSLFDQMTMVSDGVRVEQQIAFPFEKFRAQLEARLDQPMLVTLIPKGRSLQRNATDQPFRFPRVVMTPRGEGRGTADDLGFFVKDRLYVGYVEASQQMEVISYNPELGRFEFQIIDNYGAGQKPRIRYANRAFCLSCHQNEAPIFSNPSWDETAANPRIQERLIAALGSDSYLGIPIKQLRNIPNEIDDSTDRANLLIPFQKLWASSCDLGDSAKTRNCRRLATEIALNFKMTGEFDNTVYIELKTVMAQGFAKNFPKGLAVPQNNIPNFNPLQDFSGKKDTSFLDKIGGDVKGVLTQLANDSNIPAEVEPLRERSQPLEVWNLAKEDYARLIFAIVGELQTNDGNWLKATFADKNTLKSALDKVEGTNASVFAQKTFARCGLLSAVANAAGVKVPRCEYRSYALMPPAEATGKPGNHNEPGEPGQTGNESLALFKQYCMGCHGSGPKNFLEGDDAEVIRRLSELADSDIKRLDWESSSAGSMPPAQSRARQALSEHPEDRRKMIDFLRSLKGS